jgi:hypothetical protein
VIEWLNQNEWGMDRERGRVGGSIVWWWKESGSCSFSIYCFDVTVIVNTIMTDIDDNYPYNPLRYRNSYLCWTRSIVTDGYENIRYVIMYNINVFAAISDSDWRLMIWYTILCFSGYGWWSTIDSTNSKRYQR